MKTVDNIRNHLTFKIIEIDLGSYQISDFASADM